MQAGGLHSQAPGIATGHAARRQPTATVQHGCTAVGTHEDEASGGSFVAAQAGEASGGAVGNRGPSSGRYVGAKVGFKFVPEIGAEGAALGHIVLGRISFVI